MRRIASPHRKCPTASLIAAMAAATLVFAGQANADDAHERLNQRLATDVDREAVDSLDFILTLELNTPQARAILPLFEQACALHLEHYRSQSEIIPAEIRAYTAFLAEDRLNQGFSPAVEQETMQIHHRAIEANETHAEALNDLAAQAARILSPAQLQVAEAYRPDRHAVLNALSTPQERRKALRRQQKRLRKSARSGARPVSVEQSDPILNSARHELETISRAIRPRPVNIARYLLAPAAAEPLYELANARPTATAREAVQVWRAGQPSYPRSELQRDQQTLQNLKEEINNWNLTNGMYFDRAQIEQLVYLADQAARLRFARDHADRRDRLDPMAFNAQMVRLEFAAESVLRQGQLDVLRDYKPCLIPPKNLKDPVRVGQANTNDHLVRWLEHARTQNEAAVYRLIDRLIDREIERLGPLTDRGRCERERLLADTVHRAADMTDVEFALNQDDLAEAIQPRDRKDELITAINGLRRQRLLPGRTTQFLLNDGFARVLMMRHRQLSGAPATVATAANH